jgi:hypothetical protein
MADGSIDPAEDHRHQVGREKAAVVAIAKHYRYPQTVGNDTVADNFNFNSHTTSEYAKLRMNVISEITHEPFMLFEFMKINTPTEERTQEFKEATENIVNEVSANEELKNLLSEDFLNSNTGITGESEALKEKIKLARKNVEASQGSVQGFMDITKPAQRHYTGSIALYMPTDIQVNDSLVYTEDTRRFGAAAEAIRAGEGIGGFDPTQLINNVTITGALAAVGAKLGGKSGALVAALGGYGIGDIVTQELQRTLGRKGNPNEFAAYENTALRSFTFNWTLLPDNEYESKQAAGLIKFFRKSAHATRGGPLKITVPDECIVSFHGAKDMIQIPPCFIESVNVTYNPNVSSFFRRNNSPVEIGLGITVKEIVPIYSDDVERGY